MSGVEPFLHFSCVWKDLLLTAIDSQLLLQNGSQKIPSRYAWMKNEKWTIEFTYKAFWIRQKKISNDFRPFQWRNLRRELLRDRNCHIASLILLAHTRNHQSEKWINAITIRKSIPQNNSYENNIFDYCYEGNFQWRN